MKANLDVSGSLARIGNDSNVIRDLADMDPNLLIQPLLYIVSFLIQDSEKKLMVRYGMYISNLLVLVFGTASEFIYTSNKDKNTLM